ncbi:MAG: transglutaminase-like domain-containing protein [Candidatus Dojkabacteria bacterium]|nr:transglutaminase-like domain-containing protein [Candidatus Dojkabacteria bacterium]
MKINNFVILTIFFILLSTHQTHAQVLNTLIHQEYIISSSSKDSESVEIIETKERKLINQTYYVELTPENSSFIISNIKKSNQSIETLMENLKNSEIIDENNNKIAFTYKITENKDIIVYPKYNKLLQYNQTSKLTFKYKSPSILFRNGSIVDIYIGGLGKEFNSNNTIENIQVKYTLKISKNLGEILFVLPKKEIISLDEKFNFITYNTEELIGKSVWIQIGKQQNYSFVIEQEYVKTSDFPFILNEYTIVVPKNFDNGYIKQNVFFSEIIPNPSKIVKDENNNLFLVFKIPASSNGKIIIKGYVNTRKKDNLDFLKYNNLGNLSDIDKAIIDSYTKPGKYWEVDSDLIKKEIKDIFVKYNIPDNEDNIFKISEIIYGHIIKKIDYSVVKKYGLNERQGAVKTLEGNAAVCMEYSDLLITLLRAAGIPSRAAFGYAYSSLDNVMFEETESTINHQWVEIYSPIVNKWLPVDPTWGENGLELIAKDMNRLYLYHTHKNPLDPSPMQVNYVVADKNIVFPKQKFTINVVNHEIAWDQLISENELDKIIENNQDIYLREIFTTVSNTFNNFNNQLDSLIIQIIRTQDKSLLNLIKILAFIVIFLIIIVVVIIYRYVRK